MGALQIHEVEITIRQISVHHAGGDEKLRIKLHWPKVCRIFACVRPFGTLSYHRQKLLTSGQLWHTIAAPTVTKDARANGCVVAEGDLNA